MLTDWLADEPDWADALSVERIELEGPAVAELGGPKNSNRNEGVRPVRDLVRASCCVGVRGVAVTPSASRRLRASRG